MYRPSIETEAIGLRPRIEMPRQDRSCRPIKRTTTMSTNRNIAVIATLATLIAAPAFALDQDTAATTINSGRYFGVEQVSYKQHRVPTGAYASARDQGVVIEQPAVQQRDFQLEGRGLGE